MIMRSKILWEWLASLRDAHQETVTVLKSLHAAETAASARREEAYVRQIERLQDDLDSREDANGVMIATLSKQLDDARREIARAMAENVVLDRTLSIAQNNFEWARLRLNEVERERAELVRHALGLTLPVPILTREQGPASVPVATPDDHGTGVPGLLEGMGLSAALFEDLGDEKARAEGYEVAEQGPKE